MEPFSEQQWEEACAAADLVEAATTKKGCSKNNTETNQEKTDTRKSLMSEPHKTIGVVEIMCCLSEWKNKTSTDINTASPTMRTRIQRLQEPGTTLTTPEEGCTDIMALVNQLTYQNE